MAYENTDVPVSRSQGHIRDLLRKHGAQQFSFSEAEMLDGTRLATVDFVHQGHAVRIRVPLRPPDPDDIRKRVQRARSRTREQIEADAYEQEERRIWRVLFHTLKARLVVVEEGVETFEQAFLAHLVDPATGLTVWERVRPAIDCGALQLGGQGMAAIESTSGEPQ